MDDSGDSGEQLNLNQAVLRGVARRPIGGSPKNFFRDLMSLLKLEAIKATI